MEHDHIIKILTWNINGGSSTLDYDKNNEIEYFYSSSLFIANAIKKINPDIVCLQEVHIKDGVYSQTKQIADLLNFKHYSECAFDNTHLIDDCNLKIGISVISNSTIIYSKKIDLPNPHISSMQKNGDVWKTHNKGILKVQIFKFGYKINILNLHLLPFHRFEKNLTDKVVQNSWLAVDEKLNLHTDNFTIIAGDFNQNSIITLLPTLFNNPKNFVDTKFNSNTHNNTYFDHIVFSDDFKFSDNFVFSEIKISDHYPCLIILKLKM